MPQSTFGHNLQVGVAFQFLQVGRSMIEVNVRYSASKLMTSLPQSGHNRPVEVTFQFLKMGRPVVEVSVRYSAIK